MRTTRLSALLGLLVAWTGVHAQGTEAPFPVISASYETVARENEFEALIEAVNQSTVSAQTSGRVVEVRFDVDDFVQKGEVLLRLRDNDQRAAVRAAEARARETDAGFRRAKELLAKQLIAKSIYDSAEAAYKAANAALEQAREQLEHTVVRAPYSGIVVERHVEVGETASPGQPLMTGLSLEALRATASVPQAHIGTVRAMARARVILPSDDSVEGKALTISPFADPQSHTFKVRVDLPEGAHGIYPGMFAKVAFVTGEEKRLLVPVEAVVHRSEVTAVYVRKADGRISFRQVRIGETVGGKVVVLAGLSEGEQVALDPIKAGIVLKEQRAGRSS